MQQLTLVATWLSLAVSVVTLGALIFRLGAVSNDFTVLKGEVEKLRAQIAAADARNEAAFASYERTVLGALEETEGALVTYNRSQQQAQALFDAAVSAERAAAIRFAMRRK